MKDFWIEKHCIAFENCHQNFNFADPAWCETAFLGQCFSNLAPCVYTSMVRAQLFSVNPRVNLIKFRNTRVSIKNWAGHGVLPSQPPIIKLLLLLTSLGTPRVFLSYYLHFCWIFASQVENCRVYDARLARTKFLAAKVLSLLPKSILRENMINIFTRWTETFPFSWSSRQTTIPTRQNTGYG